MKTGDQFLNFLINIDLNFVLAAVIKHFCSCLYVCW